MTIRKLPALPIGAAPDSFAFQPTEQTLKAWNPALRARGAEGNGENVISILDFIGEDFWTGAGVTAKRIQAELKNMSGPLRVVINSPGGLVDEGTAIYHQLREYKGEVTVQVIGLAASIASVIAMAGDKIQIGRAAKFMIHNAWGLCVGNRHDMRQVADWLEPYDMAMVEVYAARTGQAKGDLIGMMDRETYLFGDKAIEKGFADELLPSDQVEADPNAKAELATAPAAHRIDALLARAGAPRGERRRLLQQFVSTGTRNAAEGATQIAGASDLTAALENLRSIKINP